LNGEFNAKYQGTRLRSYQRAKGNDELNTKYQVQDSEQ
jgi:hypothetical protein